MYIGDPMAYTFREYQEQADHCGTPATPTECEAIADLMRRAVRGEDTAARAAQIARSFPDELKRAAVRGVRARATV
jgi:hypothetical protein